MGHAIAISHFGITHFEIEPFAWAAKEAAQ
jgi:hypothetical protein